MKEIALLRGILQGIEKYCYFRCELYSSATNLHYIQKYWTLRKWLTPGKINVDNTWIVSPKKIILSALHIKLDIAKLSVSAIDTNYLYIQFRRRDVKIKKGIFVNLQIRDIFKEFKFENQLNHDEKKV